MQGLRAAVAASGSRSTLKAVQVYCRNVVVEQDVSASDKQNVAHAVSKFKRTAIGI